MNGSSSILIYQNRTDGPHHIYLLAGQINYMILRSLSPPVLNNTNVNLVLCWPTKCSTVIFYIRQQKDDGIFYRKRKQIKFKRKKELIDRKKEEKNNLIYKVSQIYFRRRRRKEKMVEENI